MAQEAGGSHLPLPSAVEGSRWDEGLLLGRPPEEPEQPTTENSLLEVLDGAVMTYGLGVHQQLGKVSRTGSAQCAGACVPGPVCLQGGRVRACLGRVGLPEPVTLWEGPSRV